MFAISNGLAEDQSSEYHEKPQKHGLTKGK